MEDVKPQEVIKLEALLKKSFGDHTTGNQEHLEKKERELTVKRKKRNLIERKGNLPFVKKKGVERRRGINYSSISRKVIE